MIKSLSQDESLKSGRIFIPGLVVTVPLQPHQFYRLEEDVPDIHERVNQLCRQYNLTPPKKSDLVNSVGCHWYLRLNGVNGTPSEEAHIILLKNGIGYHQRTFSSGHEHGHLIWETGYKDLIYAKCKQREILERNTRDSEDFADACGSMALKRLCGSMALKSFGRDSYGRPELIDPRRIIKSYLIMDLINSLDLSL